MRKILLTGAVLIIAISVSAQSYTVNTENSTVSWIGKKISKQHNGTVGLKEASFKIEDNKFVSGVFIVDMDIMTDESHPDPNEPGRLIGHLKSDDFFGVEKYPEAKLEITGSDEFKDGKAKVNGKLTIKGKTHPISFVAERTGLSFKADMTFDRSLYDVRYGSGKFFEDLGDKAIFDEIEISVSVIAERERPVSGQ